MSHTDLILEYKGKNCYKLATKSQEMTAIWFLLRNKYKK